MTFAPPDEMRFPSLGIARRASCEGGTLPAVMNAANEAAVGFFLEERIPFPAIMALTERVMDNCVVVANPTLAQIAQADRWARERVALLA